MAAITDDKDSIKKKARSTLSTTANYGAERHKLSSKGKPPTLDEFKLNFLVWLVTGIKDKVFGIDIP